MQTEPPCQHLKGIPHYLLRLLAKLPVEIRFVVSIHAALEGSNSLVSVDLSKNRAAIRKAPKPPADHDEGVSMPAARSPEMRSIIKL